VGVDAEGKKHILGIEPGATENAASVKRLLTHLRDHGLPTDRQYLFVIDGPKLCERASRRHSAQHGQALNLMRAAWKVKTGRMLL
jgi:transposase-like protein